MTDEEKFFAWLDGELSDPEATEMESRVERDPELAELARRHRAMQARLASAFSSVEQAPIPERLLPTGQGTAEVVKLEERRRPTNTARLPQWALMAASLAFGVFAGTLFTQRDKALIDVDGGAIYASGELGSALESQLASAQSGGDIRLGLTFRDAGGVICRSFSGETVSGLACRDDRRWRLRGLFPAAEGQSGDFRMAGTNPGLAALLDSTMTGEAMDSSEEAAALERGWR